jgi:hypothetical protein
MRQFCTSVGRNILCGATLLGKIAGKDRSADQATRSERRAASLGLRCFRHMNATAMDSLGIPQ